MSQEKSCHYKIIVPLLYFIILVGRNIFNTHKSIQIIILSMVILVSQSIKKILPWCRTLIKPCKRQRINWWYHAILDDQVKA